MPPGDGGHGGTELVVEFVDGVDIGGRGADTAVGDVGAADHDDASDQPASFELGTDLDEIRLDLTPAERPPNTGHDRLRCRAEARSHTLYRATDGGVSAMV